METFPERLAFSIEETGLGRPEFAARAGVGTSALAKWLSGKITPKSDQLYCLAKTAGVSMEWLLTGKGPKRMGLELWKHGMILSAKIAEAAIQEQNPDDGLKMIFRLREGLQGLAGALQPDDPGYVSAEELRSFCQAFLSADLKEKLLQLGKDGNLFAKYPRMLEILESGMKECLRDG